MAANPLGDTLILGAPGIEGNVDEKAVLEPEIKGALAPYDSHDGDSDDHIIVTGADAAAHLLPMRDDHDPSLTFRSLFLATCLSAFQAVVYQIYQVRLCHLRTILNVPDTCR
jgi:hypothetical protein